VSSVPMIRRAALVLACLAAVPALPRAAGGPQAPAQAAPTQQAPARVASDLDAFMEKALARREVNRRMLNDYILDEAETFEILGPGRFPLHRSKRDFTWYVRDGMHVRSPVRFGGVGVSVAERDEYEKNWIRREKARLARVAKKQKEDRSVSIGPGGIAVETGSALSAEPRFVSEAYFMDFKFEPGNYYLAGREQLEGKDVLRIEYYPTHLFDDDDKKTPKETPKRSKEQRAEEDIDRKMNKTALVTLWVDPAEHQIVKYTFDNVWLDFLPGAWLVKIDDLRASMSMGQPFAGVWLPREIDIHAGITLANGSFEAGYGRRFKEYREAQIKTTIKVPKMPESPKQPEAPRAPDLQPAPEAESAHGPFVPDAAGQEIVREIRVHGNASLLDEDVLKLAGIAVGDTVTEEGLKTIERRLKVSGVFESVDVRKRYRSLDDPSDVAILLVVHEHPGVRSAGPGKPPVRRPLYRLTHRLMFLPILGYDDGYGFTYGARVSTVDLLGAGERLSVPGTWGGTKRVALEMERVFKSGPLTRVTSSAAIWQRENPRFLTNDTRVELKAGVERQFAHMVRVGADTSRSSVSFAALDDRLWTVGAHAALDTRGDPSFPGNAVYIGGDWTALHVNHLPRINRYTADTRGYLRVYKQAVLAGAVQYYNTDAPLPPYERLLLGGAGTLRGFRAGTFDGDRMLVTGAELRVPITSVLSGAKLGVVVFADTGRVADHGVSLRDQPWHKGFGGGIFMIAPLVQINLDVAHGRGGDTRLHLSTGFRF